MRTLLTILACSFAGLCLTACSLFAPATATTAAGPLAGLVTPANLAAATTDTNSAVGATVLAKNPSYTAEVQAAADAFAALAASNLTILTGADVTATLAKTGISATTQQALASGITIALGIYERDFSAKLPTLKPDYSLFVKAIANGLLGALGKPPIS